MIYDRIERLGLYPELHSLAKDIQEFIERYQKERLPSGSYPIVSTVSDEILALVQRYRTKEITTCRPESHRKYVDIQIVLKGREYIYYSATDSLNVLEDRRPEEDLIFYDQGEPMIQQAFTKGCFGVYRPDDAHMPCIQWEKGNAEEVEKIVFKIPVGYFE